MQPDPQFGRAPNRLGMYAWAAVWMWPLVAPISAMAHGQVHPIVPAAIGLAAFVALYLFCVGRGFGNEFRKPTPIELAGLIGFAALGIALALAYGGNDEGWLVLPLYIGAAGASLLTNPLVVPWVFGATIVQIAFSVGYNEGWGDGWSNVFGTFMGSLLVLVVKRLIWYVRQLHNARAELAQAAVAEERLRFARDLHELLGHTLTLIVVKAQVVRRLAATDPVAAGAAGADIEQIGRKALVEVREAVTGYRERAFSDELDGARSALSGAGIDVSIETAGTPLPAIVDSVFGWAVREGTTNVIRHSGARHCVIAVRRAGDEATLEIRDDGSGGSPDGTGTGNGLRGLRERLAAAGGTLAAAPQPGGGFRLVATVPVATA
ncbi:sensor histidine kinase [Rugosimonospora africana]|uniref:sensor histidine kinase n=1 Tax=Rugosimonospora africana TaxID=556532 RepID=UPI0019454286|nr:histidine kinase [Rugosimonospora africana]